MKKTEFDNIIKENLNETQRYNLEVYLNGELSIMYSDRIPE